MVVTYGKRIPKVYEINAFQACACLKREFLLLIKELFKCMHFIDMYCICPLCRCVLYVW